MHAWDNLIIIHPDALNQYACVFIQQSNLYFPTQYIQIVESPVGVTVHEQGRLGQ